MTISPPITVYSSGKALKKKYPSASDQNIWLYINGATVDAGANACDAMMQLCAAPPKMPINANAVHCCQPMGVCQTKGKIIIVKKAPARAV